MKLQYKLGLIAMGLVAFTSCEKNDPIADLSQIGQRVPTCYWEVGSTVCKAGESFSFKGQYYTEDGHTPSHSEVWYNVVREDQGEASAKLGGFSYTKSYTTSDTVRTNQSIVKFEHDTTMYDLKWSGYQWILNGEVPVSETLTPINWNTPKAWGASEEKNYKAYIPAGFDVEFCEEVGEMLITDSYYSNLRNVYMNYEFSNEYVDSINKVFNVSLPTDIAYDPADAQAGVTDKSTRWYDYDNTKKQNTPAEIVGYYYPTIVDSVTVYNEVAMDVTTTLADGTNVLAADTTVRVYPVYESSPWVFSRFEDDKGAVVSTVRPEYIPAFAEMLSIIPFTRWINGGADGYAIIFKRKYKLDANFRVFDTEGNVGVAHTSYSIEVN